MIPEEDCYCLSFPMPQETESQNPTMIRLQVFWLWSICLMQHREESLLL